MSVVFRRDPTRGFRMWHILEIYTGEAGTTTESLYVPNVDDVVFDGGSTFYKVTAVDSVTAIPTLEKINPSESFNNTITDPDTLTDGLRFYRACALNRIFVDNAYSPAVCSVDAAYRIYGSEATQAKLFLGTDTSPNGTVISQTLDSNNVVISEMIDLEPLLDSNNTIHRPKRFHTTVSLQDGELVTLVVYNAAGRVSGETAFIIKNASAIAGPAASDVYIEDIELVSDLLSSTDPLLIENPLNVPFTTAMLLCKVHYSNGAYALHAIDGNKVKLHGLSGFNTSLLGPVTRVVLSYYPSADEPAINLNGVNTPSLSKTYKLANVPTDTNFSVKLYVVPEYTGSGYNLRFFVGNIDYTLFTEVTDYVDLVNANGGPYVPNRYGYQQPLVATLNLDLAGIITPDLAVHVQTFNITLREYGAIDVDPWVIDYGNDGVTVYGIGKFAQASQLGEKKFIITCGITNELDWVSYLYYFLDPLFDNTLLSEAPTPSHFSLEHDGMEIGTFPVSDWDREFELTALRNWNQHKPLNIFWKTVDNGVYKTLAVSPLYIHYDYT